MLGGTFDPPHVGHLAAAQDVVEALGLRRILFLPAARPPHKPEEDLTPARLRLRMVRSAVEGDPRFEVSELEMTREGPSYTVETLAALVRGGPSASLHLILGADQWAGFHTWKDPDRIADLARIVVMTREGEGVEQRTSGPGSGAKTLEVPVVRMDLSSSELRERVRQGRSIRYLVPDGVRRIIEGENLYL